MAYFVYFKQLLVLVMNRIRQFRLQYRIIVYSRIEFLRVGRKIKYIRIESQYFDGTKSEKLGKIIPF